MKQNGRPVFQRGARNRDAGCSLRGGRRGRGGSRIQRGIERSGQGDIAGGERVDGAGQGEELGVGGARVAQADDRRVDGRGQFSLPGGGVGYRFGECFKSGHKFNVLTMILLFKPVQPFTKRRQFIAN